MPEASADGRSTTFSSLRAWSTTPHSEPNAAEAANAPRAGRYAILGEIARGGMGAVFRGRDPDLGRDLALKVLLDRHQDRPDVVQRFIEEAQIGGRLQHPGVVPVYELGRFPDQRPFFTMKLVQGETLATLLARRADLLQDRPRFLKIFEQICQALAYAHNHGTIHRDLKPLNVMVGGFGEVQVMDWGLAKVLTGAGRDHVAPHAGGDAATARDETGLGSVLGTPAYMAPEQARGEIESVDERADVFGLGAILCEILTGQPPYGHVPRDIMASKARAGDLAEALERLDRSGADVELLPLARSCLAAMPMERPPHAGVVAEAMTAYLAGVEERLRASEIARAAETARAEEAQAKAAAERRARRMTLGLAGSIVGALLLAGSIWFWFSSERQARRLRTTGELSLALQDGRERLGQAEATGDLQHWADGAGARALARRP